MDNHLSPGFGLQLISPLLLVTVLLPIGICPFPTLTTVPHPSPSHSHVVAPGKDQGLRPGQLQDLIGFSLTFPENRALHAVTYLGRGPGVREGAISQLATIVNAWRKILLELSEQPRECISESHA